ncbi:MAG TPA: hypothetical protein DCX08_01795 [Porticoccaceae bacterium]|jgi:hypothetical protein|nr:hypothetical protein [Porticoccaceae bacterium]
MCGGGYFCGWIIYQLPSPNVVLVQHEQLIIQNFNDIYAQTSPFLYLGVQSVVFKPLVGVFVLVVVTIKLVQ